MVRQKSDLEVEEAINEIRVDAFCIFFTLVQRSGGDNIFPALGKI